MYISNVPTHKCTIVELNNYAVNNELITTKLTSVNVNSTHLAFYITMDNICELTGLPENIVIMGMEQYLQSVIDSGVDISTIDWLFMLDAECKTDDQTSMRVMLYPVQLMLHGLNLLPTLDVITNTINGFKIVAEDIHKMLSGSQPNETDQQLTTEISLEVFLQMMELDLPPKIDKDDNLNKQYVEMYDKIYLAFTTLYSAHMNIRTQGELSVSLHGKPDFDMGYAATVTASKTCDETIVITNTVLKFLSDNKLNDLAENLTNCVLPNLHTLLATDKEIMEMLLSMSLSNQHETKVIH